MATQFIWVSMNLFPGVMQCGPASLKAIKHGEVYLPYDTTFLFGEVNGDRVYWEVAADGSMEVTGIDKNSVGTLISTKKVGSDHREDVTSNYKFPEGTDHIPNKPFRESLLASFAFQSSFSFRGANMEFFK